MMKISSIFIGVFIVLFAFMVIPSSVQASTLTVDFPGITSVHTYVMADDGVPGSAGGILKDQLTYVNSGQAIFYNLPNGKYDVVVVKNAKTKIIDAVDCTASSCTVNNIVATLTVKFPGISIVHTYVKVDDNIVGTATGGAVSESTYKTDQTSIVVLKSKYDVTVVKGEKTKIIDAVDCTVLPTCTVDNIVSTMEVKFPGISSVHTYVKVDDGKADSASGGDVDSITYKTDQTSIVVLKNTYDVKVVKGAKTKIIDAVDCTGEACEIKEIVATLTLNFPGQSNVHTYVKVDDGTANI